MSIVAGRCLKFWHFVQLAFSILADWQAFAVCFGEPHQLRCRKLPQDEEFRTENGLFSIPPLTPAEENLEPEPQRGHAAKEVRGSPAAAQGDFTSCHRGGNEGRLRQQFCVLCRVQKPIFSNPSAIQEREGFEVIKTMPGDGGAKYRRLRDPAK